MDMAKRGRGLPPKNPSSASSFITDPEFFEVFLPDQVSHQLLIPRYFYKHFQRSVPEKVILTDLSGKVWLVVLKQEKDGVYLKNGWNQFVKDKALKLGEFLVFRYNENSGFTVRIFASNSCKHFVKIESTEDTDASKVAGPEFSNSEEHPQFFKIYMPDHCSTQLRIPPAFIKYFKGVLPSKSILVTSARKSWEVNVEKINAYLCFHKGWKKFVKDYSLEFGDFLVFYYNGVSRFFVTVFAKDNRPKELVGKFKADDNCSKQLIDGLSFEVRMTKTYVERSFAPLPPAFLKDVKEQKGHAKLRISGQTWDVKVVGSGTRSVKLCAGWMIFAKDNSLCQGDVCSFKLVDIEGDFYVFNVSVTRAS